MPFPLCQRLLRDLAEMQADPYPNITLHNNDSLTQACLILSPKGQDPLHLTMAFNEYPLRPPVVTIQSEILHPNVFGTYVCASILNEARDYTPAYTLKSIAVQLLSFFSSETLEQDTAGGKVNLERYRQQWSKDRRSYHCVTCGFDDEARRKERVSVSMTSSRQAWKGFTLLSRLNSSDSSGAPRKRTDVSKLCEAEQTGSDETPDAITRVHERATSTRDLGQMFLALPDEMLLTIFSELSDQDLWAVAKVFPVITKILNLYDFIRVRELQCFCLKESFRNAKLGVGVNIQRRGREGTFESEFDLLSQQAFRDYDIRKSVQGLPFEYWLPLPISRRHWRLVVADVSDCLRKLAFAAQLKDVSGVNVVYHFMNDIVVKFSQEAEKCFDKDRQSSLTHVSEKAVESYFALFHLLLCLVAEDPDMIRAANSNIASFLAGSTSKSSCPSLGSLLVVALVSDAGITEQLRLAIIKEAVLRNVVWMLDRRGANMHELAYLEPSAISDYRLRHTFQASKTSYRLLMFLGLFCKTARGEGKSLAAIRDDMFDAHGAPPKGTAERMAREIRRIKDVDSFPPFFTAMGISDIPSKETFTAFLRRMVRLSEEKGYSRMPITQGEALALRKEKEPGVEVASGVACGLMTRKVEKKVEMASFFPGGSGGGGRGRGIGR